MGCAAALIACGGAPSADDGGALPGQDAAARDGGALADSGGGADGAAPDSGADSGPAPTQLVFVIPLENKAQTQIYGNMSDAPYINGTLMPAYAHTTAFGDALPALMSEPHYVWMESGTNVFQDHTFATDNDSSSSNSTSSTEHLVTQLKAAGVSWMAYQEGIAASSCPIKSTGFYAAKHDPFVFFQDVAGNPPSSSNAYCASHHKPLSALAADLQSQAVARYNFITPDVCHDMHGDNACPQANTNAANIKAGDDWLKANLPPIITYALAHDGVVFLTWDEGDASNLIPFIAIGKWVKKGYASKVKVDHSSLLKTEEEIFGVPALAKVQAAADLSDLFEPGHFP